MVETTCIDSVVNVLEKWQVEKIFGCPGTTEIPFLQSLRKHPNIKYITTYLDGLAVGMADGYARSSGNVGIVNLHATQGTLNAYGFIRAALRDESPIVIISGVPSLSYELVEPTHFVYGLTNILRNVTKWAWQIKSPEQTEQALNRAIKIATTPPFGPTFIGIPQDVQVQSCKNGAYSLHQSNNAKMQASPEQIKKLSEIMLSSKKPIIFAGKKAGEMRIQKEIKQLAETIGAPVVSEAPDRGPQIYTIHMNHDHPLYLGYYGNRDEFINSYIKSADTILEINCKQTYPRIIKDISSDTIMVQIMQNPHELGKYHPISHGIAGDLEQNVSLLIRQLQLTISEKSTKEIQQRIKSISSLTNKRCLHIQEELGKPEHSDKDIYPKQIIKSMIETLPKDAVFIDEAQSFSWFLKRYFPFTTSHIAYGTNASHIGWGMPFAAGAASHHSNKKLVCIVSDSAFLMGSQTLGTIAKDRLPVLVIVINNRGFSSLKIEFGNYEKIDDEQGINELNFTDKQFNYSKVSEGMGVSSFVVSKPNELTNTLRKAVAVNGPAVVDIQCDNTNKTWNDGWYKAPAK
jgi:benzoylformate decarboxylase